MVILGHMTEVTRILSMIGQHVKNSLHHLSWPQRKWNKNMPAILQRNRFVCGIGLLILLAIPAMAKPPGGKGGGNGGGGEDPPPPPTPEVSYSIEFLDTLGGVDITAYGMNGQGDVVGQSDTEVIGTRSWQHGYLYSYQATAMIDLHDLFVAEGLLNDPIDTDTGTGWLVSSAIDVNDAGQIIGTLKEAVAGVGVGQVPFRYTPADGTGGSAVLEEINPLIPGSDITVRAVNNSGVVAGYAQAADGYDHAIVWSNSIDGTADLGLLNGQDTITNDISDAGELCGQLNGVSRAWRLGSSGFDNLGKLQKGKSGSSFGNSINLLGDVAGLSSKNSTTYRVFLYTDANGMQDLGTLGGNDSYGGYLNNLGEVVGTSRLASETTSHAFLYTQEAMVDLEESIAGFSASSYYGLLTPLGINDTGTILGVTSNGTGLDRQVFVLTRN